MLTKLQTALRLLPSAAQRTDSAGQRLASLNPSTKRGRGCWNNKGIPVVGGEDQKFKVTLSYAGEEANLGYKTPCLKKQKVKELLNSSVRLVNTKVYRDLPRALKKDQQQFTFESCDQLTPGLLCLATFQRLHRPEACFLYSGGEAMEPLRQKV